MTLQPTLSLWDEPAPDHRERIVAYSHDRVSWIRARSRGVTATDAARLSSDRAVDSIAAEKLAGRGFTGNAFTDHGRTREPVIARWVLQQHRIHPSAALFHALDAPRHLATPDGVSIVDGALVLAEIKTTRKAWRTIPRSYLRQVWWQQYVLGADRTLVVWEEHDAFVPVHAEPRCQWVDRDDNEIHQLIRRAEMLIERLPAPIRP